MEEVGGGEDMGALIRFHSSVGVVKGAVLKLAKETVLEWVVVGEVVLPKEDCLVNGVVGVVFIVGLVRGFGKPLRVSGIVSDLVGLMFVRPGSSWRRGFDGSLINGVRGRGTRRCRR